MEARRARAIAVSLGFALYAGFSLGDFLGPGLPVVFDAHSHLARSAFVADAFGAGRLPSWSNAWYGGFRLLEFYTPGYYWLVGGLARALGDVALATKLALWVGQLLSVLVLHALLRRLTESTLLALLGAVLLVRSVERQMVLGVIGNHPSLLLYVAIPLYLWTVWRGAGSRRMPGLVAQQALLLGTLLLAHGANALLALPGLLAFAALRLWQCRPTGAGWGHVAARVLLPVLLAGLLAAFAFVPALSDRHLVSLALDRPGLVPFDPLRSLGILSGLSPPTFDAPFLWAYGTAWFALGVVGALLAWVSSARDARPFAAGFAVNLGCVLLLDDRAAIAGSFFLAPLCVVTLDVALRAPWATRIPGVTRLVPALALGAALVHPGPDSQVSALFATESDFDVYRQIPETPTRSRTFDVTPTSISLDGFYGQSSFSPVLSGRAIPFGGYPQAAPLATNVLLGLGSRLVEDLRAPEPRLSESSLDFLYLTHVGFLVERGDAGSLGALAKAPGAGTLVGPQLLRLEQASPALFAEQLGRVRGRAPEHPRAAASGHPLLLRLEQRWEQDALGAHRHRSLDLVFRTGRRRDWEIVAPFVERMGIDRAAAVAREILVAEPPAAPARAALSGAAVFRVVEHREAARSVEILAEASHPGFVRLAYTHDPRLRVLLDGQPVPSVPDALGGAVVLRFPAGAHRIGLAAPETRAGPRLGLGLSVLLALALLAVSVVQRDAGPRSPMLWKLRS